MKCLKCEDREGAVAWSLTPADFLRYGESIDSYKVEDCFCETCYKYLNLDSLNNLLFEYWKQQQQPTKETETLTKELYFPTADEYPEDYKWFAYDASGRACFYKVKPVQKDDYWYPESDSAYDWENAVEFLPSKFEYFDDVPNWKETLRYKGDLIKQSTVNKPNYYTWHPAIECYKVTQHFMSNLGQAIQYIWRSGNPEATKGQSKEELIQDLRKAIRFIEFEIERLSE